MGWMILGAYKGRDTEEIDCFGTKDEAIKMLEEYHVSFGPEWGNPLDRRGRGHWGREGS